MAKLFIITLIVLVGLAGFYFGFIKNKGEVVLTPTVTSTFQPTVIPTPVSTPVGNLPSVKTFTVTGTSFEFSPDIIIVNKGDTVKIVYKNLVGLHDWRIDEFNTATKVITGGQEETVQFVADKAGRFEFYCSVGNHRQKGMTGALIVE